MARSFNFKVFCTDPCSTSRGTQNTFCINKVNKGMRLPWPATSQQGTRGYAFQHIPSLFRHDKLYLYDQRDFDAVVLDNVTNCLREVLSCECTALVQNYKCRQVMRR